MSEPRELLERLRAYLDNPDGWGDGADQQFIADIDAYLAAPPAQPPRVTAEMVREAHRGTLSWDHLSTNYQQLADALNARLSAEREPAEAAGKAPPEHPCLRCGWRERETITTIANGKESTYLSEWCRPCKFAERGGVET